MGGCPRMDRCCLCLTVRTGSLALGIAGIIFDVFGMAILGAGLGGAIYIFENPEKTLNDPGMTDEGRRQIVNDNRPVFYALLSTLLVIVILHLICCCLLVNGVKMDNHNLLVPWIVFTLISGVLYIITFFTQVCNGELSSPIVIILSISGIITIFYFTWCVHSHYINLKMGENTEVMGKEKKPPFKTSTRLLNTTKYYSLLNKASVQS